jgi:VIT1/CCC1 family predicted Fe2+/Mn2+ transporter
MRSTAGYEWRAIRRKFCARGSDMHPLHREAHLIERIGWLRAAVLGANDGIISTASLVVGVAAAATSPHEVVVAGVAGLVAGATAMAAGEYVSVSSQADTEAADLTKERRELAEQPDAELRELTNIYVERGLEVSLARQVAEALTAKDAFAAHARDELGLSAHVVARPVQAALTSAVTFAVGAAVPLVIVLISPPARISWLVSAGSLVALAILGAVGARAGGAGIMRPMLRVTFWGAIAMGTTAAIGRLVGHAI